MVNSACIKRTLSLMGVGVLGVTVVTAGLGSRPAVAADPFRGESRRNIGSNTEQAFKALFRDGNYPLARRLLTAAEAKEGGDPMVHALRASLAYMDGNWAGVQTGAQKTLNAAKAMKNSDALRSNLYMGVGTFLDGAYQYNRTKNAVAALGRVQTVLNYFNAAEKLNPQDPEVNLIKGYTDLLLAVNLPWASPEQAIAKFQAYAAPNYLVNRGIALAYRDLKQYANGIRYADLAIQAAPNNPEHYYLKGQLLYQMGRERNDSQYVRWAITNFDRALAKAAQLPTGFVVAPLRKEKAQAQALLKQLAAVPRSPYPAIAFHFQALP